MAATIDLAALAHSIGAADLFVLRRVEADRFVHLGGSGRGEGWAGNIELQLGEETIAAEAMRRGIVQHARAATGTMRIFGPYHAARAAFVPISDDVLVVFGAMESAPPADESLMTAAHAAVEGIDHVSPAKRLADELEVLHAVRELGATTKSTVNGAARHVIGVAAAALSCELGVLWLGDAGHVWSSNPGLLPAGQGSGLAAALQNLRERHLPSCVQDAVLEPLPAPLDHIGAVAYYALGIDGEVPGLMLLIHTDARPRGFTSLCQMLGVRLAGAASEVLTAARQRETLEGEIARVSALAHRDALTGVGNRLAWDQALATAPPRTTAAIIVVDVDGLKATNDELGHTAGDELLRVVGTLLRDAVREQDVVARIGGDEFAVLLMDTPPTPVAERIACAVAAHPGVGGRPLSISVGSATADDARDLASLQAEADRGMYACKQARV